MDVCAETRRPIITYLQRVSKLIALFIDEEEEEGRFYLAQFSALVQTDCAFAARDSKWVTVAFYLARFLISTVVAYLERWSLLQ